jgi:hydroxymethylglutaryl-CoA lyase
MLAAMGFDVGVDLNALLSCAEVLQSLVGHEVPGQVLKAGPWDRRHAVPHSVARPEFP